ncbi:hypothetical protein ABB37_08647 [Leptomonas pyrrhocoris]|uniref:Transmembrane protein n=1 Tax=Leptomonas pyrrhocoris TaxID=157538 RepID=A0A0M9FSX0_LEPPY|nr:hypothetical protein ABB37_08647 [Leptomonas pyrrhocoris]XP_015653803.1 hypothetical protein ABB37_08647 [Leptomonas pyrrhocoris]KPA75363.1 hypothetical protein ABB37_08647 [Leptomonas pyrrhocoris]KPA75364.1 hypothetical protein ABB37_08647 [Leptomonas pyrrhocoris]|eukprot:XP_015653802.1 hypothetical protein ABB37_08647 [Leptomonas pyrrhocoris]
MRRRLSWSKRRSRALCLTRWTRRPVEHTARRLIVLRRATDALNSASYIYLYVYHFSLVRGFNGLLSPFCSFFLSFSIRNRQMLLSYYYYYCYLGFLLLCFALTQPTPTALDLLLWSSPVCVCGLPLFLSLYISVFFSLFFLLKYSTHFVFVAVTVAVACGSFFSFLPSPLLPPPSAITIPTTLRRVFSRDVDGRRLCGCFGSVFFFFLWQYVKP